jgi:hypothetical protein
MGMMNAVVAKGNSAPPALVTPPAVIPGAVPIGAPIGGASIGFDQPTALSESLYTPIPGMPGLFYMHADPKNPSQGVYVYRNGNQQTFYTGSLYTPGSTPKLTGNYDPGANVDFGSVSAGYSGTEMVSTGYPPIMGGTSSGLAEANPYGVYRYDPNGATFETSATFDNQDPRFASGGGIRPASMGGAGFYQNLMSSSVLGILGSTKGGSEIADALRTIAQSSQQTASNTGDIASNISNMDPAEVAKQLRSLLTQVREYEATHGRSIPGLATMGWDEFSRNAGAIATQAGI